MTTKIIRNIDLTICFCKPFDAFSFKCDTITPVTIVIQILIDANAKPSTLIILNHVGVM